MSLSKGNNQISFSEREFLVKSHPFFCLLTDSDIKQFVLKMSEVTFAEKDVIVKEGDLIDKIYIIAEGKADVVRNVITVEKIITTHMAYLKKGDAVGITPTGFSSSRGITAGTVIALTPIIALTINLTDFYNFSVHYPEIKCVGEKFLLMNFIQKTDLFSQMTTDKYRKLAKLSEKIVVKSGEKLFSQYDHADKCYFILSGEIAIAALNHDGQEHTQATLKEGSFFGEAALFPKGVRNASAYAVTECELFQLNQADIFNVLQFNSEIIEILKKKRFTHIIPAPSKAIVLTTVDEPINGHFAVLENTVDHKQLPISFEQSKIWHELNGNNSIARILRKIDTILTKSEVIDFIYNLSKIGFVSWTEDKSEGLASDISFWKKLILKYFFKRTK